MFVFKNTRVNFRNGTRNGDHLLQEREVNHYFWMHKLDAFVLITCVGLESTGKYV